MSQTPASINEPRYPVCIVTDADGDTWGTLYSLTPKTHEEWRQIKTAAQERALALEEADDADLPALLPGEGEMAAFNICHAEHLLWYAERHHHGVFNVKSCEVCADY